MGILCGPDTAAKMLQKAVKSCGITIAVDGNIGPVSVAALGACDEVKLYNLYILSLQKRFKRLALLWPSNRQFLAGWLRRCNYKFVADGQNDN
jgi:lysozyme family protein